MTIQEMAVLLAKVRLGDNRQVDEATVLYWQDTIGDMPLPDALDALRRFRRERPGTYLEPGHLLEMGGVSAPDTWRDYTPEIIAASKARALEAAGVTEAELDEHAHDVGWLRSKFPGAFEQSAIAADENGEPE